MWNGNFQFFVAYLGPLPALSSLIEGYTPPTPVATPRVGSKIPTIWNFNVSFWSYFYDNPIFFWSWGTGPLANKKNIIMNFWSRHFLTHFLDLQDFGLPFWTCPKMTSPNSDFPQNGFRSCKWCIFQHISASDFLKHVWLQNRALYFGHIFFWIFWIFSSFYVSMTINTGQNLL